MSARFSTGTFFRFCLVLAWVLCFAALVWREVDVLQLRDKQAVAINPSGEKAFYSILQGEKRIGRVVSALTPDGDTILLSQNATLLFQLLGKKQPVALSLTAELTSDMILKNFQVRLDTSLYHMHAKGVVEQEFLRYTLDTGKTTITNALRLKQPPRISIGRRPWLLSPMPEKNQRLRVPFLDPFTLTTRISTLTYHGREKLLINRQVRELHHFSENFSGVRISSWLDDDGHVVREHSPAGFVLVAERHSQGRPLEQGDDLLQAVAIPLEGKKQNVMHGEIARFRLILPDESRFFLTGGRQIFQKGILTVNRESLAGGDACDGPATALAPEPFVQSGNPAIRTLAQKITQNAVDDIDRVRRLTRWLFKNIRKQPVIGLPDAVTTLKNRVGDCNEHAVLFAAMARSLGIPARMAAGVALFGDTFYYHAWNEVCLAGKWVSIDATLNQVPTDLGHLRFVTGGLQEMTGIVALLNRLHIQGVKE